MDRRTTDGRTDDGRTTDDGACLYYKHPPPPGAFGSGELKIDLTLKLSNFLFLLCFKIAIIKFILMRQQSRQRNNFFSSRFTSNLMFPAC